MVQFLVPDDFRAFMHAVVLRLGMPGGMEGVDAIDAFAAECGYGGRIDGADTYQFRYLPVDGRHRWDLVISESQIRDIADGSLSEVPGVAFELVRTSRGMPIGSPLLVWGSLADDCLQVCDGDELETALERLHVASIEAPRFLRVWSAAEDQLVAALWGDVNALYVVESHEGYATSMGDATRGEAFVVHDPDGHALTVPFADCVSWDYARRALLQFVAHGDLGDVPTEGRIPSLLLMMGEIDRMAVIAARGEVPTALACSSLGDPTAQVDVEDTFSEPEAPTTE